MSPQLANSGSGYALPIFLLSEKPSIRTWANLDTQDADTDVPLGYGESLSQRSNFGFGLALVIFAVLTVLTTTLKCMRASRDVDRDRPS
jgi:hypothetical protein